MKCLNLFVLNSVLIRVVKNFFLSIEFQSKSKADVTLLIYQRLWQKIIFVKLKMYYIFIIRKIINVSACGIH